MHSRRLARPCLLDLVVFGVVPFAGWLFLVLAGLLGDAREALFLVRLLID